MSVDFQPERLIMKSIILHLQTALTTVGWTTPEDWVVEGYINDNPDSRPPVVGVFVGETNGRSFELGNSNRQGLHSVEIEVWAVNTNQLLDLLSCVSNNVDNIQIIDFNTAMPGDVGYDADAQEIARGYISDRVNSRVMDTTDHTGRVSFILRESKPI